MKLHLFIVTLLLGSFVGAASLEEKVGAFIRSSQSVPNTGYAVVIVKDGKVLMAKGYGLANRETKKPVTADTAFGIASNSKAFTAATLMILQDEKKLDITQPLKNYMPEFALKDEAAGMVATAEDLLTHRTGVPRHDLLWFLTQLTRENLFSRLQFLSPDKRPEKQFRKSYQYNNLMFMTAGYLQERITNQSWHEFVKERIFSPLGMANTTSTHAGILATADVALPYLSTKVFPIMNVDAVGPAASINSTANDMAKWVNCLLAHGKSADGKTVLSEAAVESLFQPRIEIPDQGFKSYYGLGFMINRAFGQRLISHGGSLPGYSTFVSFMPEKNLGVIVLANQQGEQAVYSEVPLRIYAELLGNEWSEAPEAKGLHEYHAPAEFHDLVPQFKSNLGKRDIHWEPTLSEYAGFFVDQGYGAAPVIAVNTPTGEKLKLVYYSHVFDLVPHQPDVFLVQLADVYYNTQIPVTFVRKNGVIHSMSIELEPNAVPVEFIRTIEN